jgi:hypothetical protein
MGILERGGKVRTKVVANRKKALLQAIVTENVAPGAEIFTDRPKVLPWPRRQVPDEQKYRRDV